jgi:hypothetical protein
MEFPPHQHTSGGQWGDEFCRAADYIAETDKLYLLQAPTGSWWVIFGDPTEHEECIFWKRVE